MAKAKIKFGDKVLERALRDFGDQVIDKVKEIVQETGVMIYNQAVALAPVDEGNLKRSITFHSSTDGLEVTVEVGAHYAIYVEYGTGIYAVEGNGRKTPWVYWSVELNRWVYTRGMEAQPFWNPSIDQGKRYFQREMNRLG